MNNKKPINPWPICISSFFVVALIGCGTFITFCSKHPADLVASDYYEQEVRYQGQLNRIKHSAQGAQLAAITYDPVTQRITISVPLHQSQARPTGNVQLYRPAAIDQDRVLKFEPNPAGVQTIDASTLVSGLWKVRVSWGVDSQEYFVEQKLVIAAKSS